MATRRDFLKAGGLALAGLVGVPMIGSRSWPQGEVVDIYMRSDMAGGDVWFDPVGVRIDPGQTVRWIVAENVHTTTAYHPANGRATRIPAASRPWDSGYLISPGDHFAVELTIEGVYDYFCIPHEGAGMVGRLVVGDPTRSPAPPFVASIPRAARRAFPAVQQIMADGRVRR